MRLRQTPDKSNLLLNSTDNSLSDFIDDTEINNSNLIELLGILIDNELKFTEHFSKLCKKASQKLHVLSSVSPYMCRHRRRIIMKAFVYNPSLATVL